MKLLALFESINSWADFVSAIAPLSNTDKGTAFAHVVRHYLRFDPKYRAKLADVWFDYEVPTDLRARLNLPPRDEGIDLIVRTHAGEFWAIQAKYRSDAKASLTHRELSTFNSLAFTVCREGAIAFALVCTTTTRIARILRLNPKLSALTAETWTELGPDFFASLRAAQGAPLPRPSPWPRKPHQRDAIAKALAHYGNPAHSRGKLISPCGSGKSLTAYWIAHDLGTRRVLIAVPSLALIRQTLKTWTREALADERPVDWLCVCSAKDFTITENQERLPIPCDTEPVALTAHLSALSAATGLLVVLTTYQSSPILAAAARTAGFAFDFAIFDEAHKTTGKTSGHFAHLLYDANLPVPRRLFMTATEHHFKGPSDDIVSMHDLALYGKKFYELSFKAAIAADPPILCDYRILTIGVRQSDVDQMLADNRYLSLKIAGDDDMEAFALTLASLVALRRATTKHGVRHTVSFHNSIPRAKQFRELCKRLNLALTSEPATAAFHVNGKMGSADRQREIDAFLASAPSLVTNARCLTEGVDIPEIDCVFFADPKGSKIEIVQAAGRALRLSEGTGKKRGYVLLPLIVPDGATLDQVAETSAFKEVLFVLRALATNDERIVDFFRAVAEGHTPEVGGLVNFDFTNVVAPLDVNAADFANQIVVRCWESVAKLAYRSYEEVQIFCREHGAGTQRQWRKLFEKLGSDWPVDIPKSPDKTSTGRGWTTWGNFFGTGRVGTRDKIFRPFAEARAFIRTVGLTSQNDWHPYCTKRLPGKPPKPTDIPSTPETVYAAEWQGWADWGGYENSKPTWWRFTDARNWVRKLKLHRFSPQGGSQKVWKAYTSGKQLAPELPPFPRGKIPTAPEIVYTKDEGWKGYADWVGRPD